MEPYDIAKVWSWRCRKQFRDGISSGFFPTHTFSLTDQFIHASDFTYYNYPGIYNYSDFHHCGLEPNDDIVNYGNAQEVWTCQLGGLAEYVRFTRFRLFCSPVLTLIRYGQFGNGYGIRSWAACRVHE
jgi:hypothetical protein